MPQVLHAATKTWQSQINELKPEQAGIVTEGKFSVCVCVDCLYLWEEKLNDAQSLKATQTWEITLQFWDSSFIYK